MRAEMPRLVMMIPRVGALRSLLTWEIKRLLRKYGKRIPRDAIIGMEWTLIGPKTGNFEWEGKPAFRVSTTSLWFSERLTNASLAIDGRKISPDEMFLLAGEEKYQLNELNLIPFIPGRVYSFIIPGLTLPDGVHFVDLRLKTDLQNLDYAGLPILLEKGQGGVPSAVGAVKELTSSDSFTVHYVPHIHYDTEWIFDRARFLEVGTRNLLDAVHLLESDPEHTFVVDQTTQMAPFFDKFPALVPKFREWVKQGRVEATNGLHAEPDVNMAGGESLVRGSILWQKFALEKFGELSKVGWFIDCFGQTAQIPQILLKSGTPYFAFNRVIHDNDHPTEFWWEGPDGSRVLTHWMKGMYNIGYPIMEDPDIADLRFRRSIGFIAPNRTSPHVLYGAGVDHGRPLGFAIERIAEWNRAHPNIPIKKSTPKKFFESLDTSKLKVVKGEFQRDLWGVYSTRIKGKIQNRRCEAKVLVAETWAAAASLFGADYPAMELEEQWNEILADQFHDCLCGCSSDNVAEGIERRLFAVEAVLDRIRDGSQKAIARRISSSQPDGVAIIVFNPLSWRRNEWIEANVHIKPGVPDVELVDESGAEIATQTLDRHFYLDGNTLELKFGFIAELPPLGWRTFYLKPQKQNRKDSNQISSASRDMLSSDKVTVEINPATGHVRSVRHKDSGLSFEMKTGNRLRLQRDWGTLYNTMPLPGGWKSGDADVRVIENGSLRAAIEVRGRISKNDYVQRISVRAGSPRVDFETEANLITPYRRLRVEFPHDFKGTWRHGVPYGVVERRKHELPARDWADLSDAKHGMTLIQFGIPGTSLEGGAMTLTLWRSTDLIHFIPAGPGALSLGKHRFRYALYPHGPYADSRPRRAAKEHNILSDTVNIYEHADGKLPQKHSLLDIDSSHLTAEAFYREGDNIIVRLLESCGASGEAGIRLGFDARSAAMTDLIGNVEKRLEIRDNQIRIPYGPYQILTLCIRP